MPATLTIRDETASGQTLHEWSLEVLTERVTVRELIRSRVYQEVQDYNRLQPAEFRGLVRPADTKSRRQIDWKAQAELAFAAFEQNRVLVLIDDRQAESLDEEVVVRPGTQATFVQLVPLVGG
jgi:hypothetical protein